MYYLLRIAFCAAVISSSIARAEEAAPRQPTKPTPLFNGSDLSGWYSWVAGKRNEDTHQVFRVADGCIHISGTQLGYLATTHNFENYELTVEYRWGFDNPRGQLARDSGLFIHSRGPDGNSFDANGAFQAGIECQVMQGATGDLMLIRGRDANGRDYPLRLTCQVANKRDQDGWPYYQPRGKPFRLKRWGRINWEHKSASWRDRIDMRGPHDVEHPAGKWNRLRCTCRNDQITIRLNGNVINHAFDVWPRSGQILLQSEGSEISFRNLIVSPVKSGD